MIYGTKYWNDRNTFHIQDNNVFEESFRKKGIARYLESCGPTSAVNAIASMRGPEFFDSIKIGGYSPQPEDLLMLFFNDPSNYGKFREIRKEVEPSAYLNNEIPQFYPFAVRTLFDIDCEFKWEHDFDKIVGYLKAGRAVMLCEPGHYVCVVAYDDNLDELIYNDPWSGHYSGGEFNIRYTRKYFEEKIAKYKIVFK